MASFIQNMLWNSVSGFVEAGTRTVGEYAGDALIKAGDLVEGGGRSVGNSIERKATGLGSSLNGQVYKPSAKALPSTARRPAAHRSNSLPANAKPGSSGVKKYPSGLPAAGGAAKKTATTATKTTGSVLGGGKSTAGGLTNSAQRSAGNISKPLGGVAGGAKSTANSLNKGAQSTANGLIKPLGGVANTASKSATNVSNTANSAAKRTLPKPYPESGPNLPKPYTSTSSYPSTEKKTPVRPGQSKPFVAPKEDEAKKPYPGTNTLPGQGNRTPVKKYKPAQRYEAPAKKGEVKHLAV